MILISGVAVKVTVHMGLECDELKMGQCLRSPPFGHISSQQEGLSLLIIVYRWCLTDAMNAQALCFGANCC